MTRALELRCVDGFVARARGSRSSALVVVGDAGVGKSWLCERAVERAQGFRAVVTRGVRSESQLGYAGLFDVLSPLLEAALGALAPARAHALRVALRLEDPAEVDPLAVAVGCLDLLAAAAESQPLLIVVDDAHWVDDASLDALRFAGRRLDADRVGLMFAVRPQGAAAFARSGFEVLSIGGLPEAEAIHALEGLVAFRPSRAVARRVVAETDGHPLALSEAARLLSADQLAGRAQLPARLPRPATLQSEYGARASALSAAAREALTLLAVAESAPHGVLERALAEIDAEADAFATHAETGLVRFEAGRPRFVHPLTQAAVWEGAAPAARRVAHRAMAVAWDAADDHERAAWHLADATDGPDAAAALAMAAVARSARARGAPYEAAQAWHRAAAIEPDPSETTRLEFEEACDLARAGRAPPLFEHVARMLDADPPLSVRADLELLRGNMLIWLGRLDEAVSLLEQAADEIRTSDLERATALLCGAAFARSMAGDVPGGVATATTAVWTGEKAGGASLAGAQLMLGWTLILAGQARRGYPLLRRWGDHAPAVFQTRAMMGQIATWVGDDETARRELERAVARARAEGCADDLPHALGALSELVFRHGEWAASRELAEEAVRLASDVGQEFHWARIQLAQLDAVTGDADGAREHAAMIDAFALQSGSRSLEIYASAALGLLELGLDAPTRAAAHLERTEALVERSGLGEPNVVQWRADLIESQCRAGRSDDAARSLATLQREADATDRRWALAASARCRALLAPAGDIDRLFADAHRLAVREPSPFELARTELCWGERLRREHRRVEARRHLNHALERFQALGAAPCGEPDSGARCRGHDHKDIAASLFLSPKTIEFHLGRIYRKLDIHSRTQLARAVLLETSNP